MTVRPSVPVEAFRDHSPVTVLPVEIDGGEVRLEARAFQGAGETTQAMVLVNPLPAGSEGAVPTVRVHSGCVTGDIFHSLRCDCHAQLQAALRVIAKTPGGVLIYLPYHEGRGIGLVKKLRAYALQDKGLDTVDANLEQGEPVDARDYAFAAAILAHLGMSRIRLMTNNPDKWAGLEAAGIIITERIPLVVEPGQHNERYLETKRRRLSHEL